MEEAEEEEERERERETLLGEGGKCTIIIRVDICRSCHILVHVHACQCRALSLSASRER